MGGAFWTSWALWEKMCFVLAGAIVLTVIGGCMKLIHTHYKLRQYIAIASKKQAQQLELGQEIEVTQRRGNDVPFGIRAIESGIEVDGVWISRPNTPLLDSPKSLAAPSIEASSLSSDTDPSNRVSSASNISRLEMPPPVRLYRASSPGRPKTSSRVQSFVGERVPSESSSLNTDPSVGRRPTYQPRHASYLGYSNPNIVRDSATMDALEGHRRDGSGSVRTSEGSEGYRSTNRSSAYSSLSGSSQGHYVPKRPGHIKFNASNTGPTGVAHPASTDLALSSDRRGSNLDSLASHRLSHAAETGQLLPRVRRGVPSGDWSGSSNASRHLSDTGDPSTAYRPSPAASTQNPFATPHTSLSLEGEVSETPTFQEFVENRPVIVQQSDLAHQDSHPGPTYNHVKALQSADANQRIRRPSHVRRANSGFEIYPAGTFDVQRQSTDQSEDLKQDCEAGDRRQSNKLKKKRRESGQNERSIFNEMI